MLMFTTRVGYFYIKALQAIVQYCSQVSQKRMTNNDDRHSQGPIMQIVHKSVKANDDQR